MSTEKIRVRQHELKIGDRVTSVMSHGLTEVEREVKPKTEREEVRELLDTVKARGGGNFVADMDTYVDQALEIAKRHRPGSIGDQARALADVGAFVAEIDTDILHDGSYAEILRAEFDAITRQRAEVRAEVERLRHTNAQLQENLRAAEHRLDALGEDRNALALRLDRLSVESVRAAIDSDDHRPGWTSAAIRRVLAIVDADESLRASGGVITSRAPLLNVREGVDCVIPSLPGLISMADLDSDVYPYDKAKEALDDAAPEPRPAFVLPTLYALTMAIADDSPLHLPVERREQFKAAAERVRALLAEHAVTEERMEEALRMTWHLSGSAGKRSELVLAHLAGQIDLTRKAEG